MELKLLVFASKAVGEGCVRFLVERYPADAYRFVLTTTSERLSEDLRALGHPVEPFGPEAVARYEAAGAGAFDWLLNLWSPHILRPALLRTATHRLNLHPSYVPHARGNDNAAWILRESLPAGVSLIEMEPNVDAGAVWHQEEIAYDFPIRGGELHAKLLEKAVQTFCAQWPSLREGRRVPTPQAQGSRAHRRAETNADREIDLERDPAAAQVVSKLLAHDFAPASTAVVKAGDRRFKARLLLEEIGD